MFAEWERRRQILRKSVEVFMRDLFLKGVDGIKKALTYKLPQINAQASVAGFSPSQWVLGKQPTLTESFLENMSEDVLRKRAICQDS